MSVKKNSKRKKKNKLIKNIKKKLKGFTLVELLAVIVILAIIMIIAIPSVLQTMTTAKQKTFDEYTTKVYTATEKEYLSEQLLGNSKSCVMYDIAKDIGLSSTGNYHGYTLVVKQDNGDVNNTNYDYYITMWDDEYMVYGLKYGNDYELEAFTNEDDTKLSKANLAAVAGCTTYEDKTTGETGDALPGGGSSNDKSPKKPFTLTDNDGDGKVSFGDEACIGGECFYVYKIDGSNVRLLSKYNLDAGYYSYKKEIIDPTGIQSEKTLNHDGPYYSTYYGNYGFVAFSKNYGSGYQGLCYWNYKDSSGKLHIKENYGGDNTESYNSDTYVYDSNSNLYTYISSYVNYLKGKGATIKESRVIKLDEVQELGCTTSNCNSAPSWVYSTSYWTGNRSAGSSIGATYVSYNHSEGIGRITKATDCVSIYAGGVRPVIIVDINQIG